MPFQSEKQRRFLHANHPEIAKRWEKEYAHGGILDITGDEEITTNDGNDIELTSYNAEFDDPNDLSTGVKTLFRAKDGGKTIKGQEHMLAYITPGEAKTLENLGGQKTMTKEGIPAYPPSDNYGGSWGGSSNTSNQNQGSDQGHSRFDVGSGYYNEPVTTTTTSSPKDDGGMGAKETYIQTQYTSPEAIASKNRRDLRNMANNWEKEWGKWDKPLDKYSYTGAGVKNRANLIDKTYNEKRAELEKKFGKNLITKIVLGFAGVPVSIGFKDVKALKSMYDLEKQYKADMQNLKDISIEQGWADFHHAVDTPMQTIDQLMMDTIRVKKDDDTSGDGPEVVPIHEEIQEYESMAANPMSLLNMRDNKALYAALSEKWEKQRREKEQQYTDYGLIPDNTAVGAVTMQANSGGLANLFRVKNQ